MNCAEKLLEPTIFFKIMYGEQRQFHTVLMMNNLILSWNIKIVLS